MTTCDKCDTCETCGKAKQSQIRRCEQHLEHGFKRFWRPAAGYAFLLICLFDFMIAPLWIEHANQTVNLKAFAEIRKFESEAVQIKAIEHIELGNRSWEPLTTRGGGLFYLAFGSILGIAAFSRGKEKVAAINTA